MRRARVPGRRAVALASALLVVAIVLFFTATPTGLDEFFQRPVTPPPPAPDSARTAGGDSVATAGGVIAIRVDVETDVSPIDVTPPPPPPSRREPEPAPPPETTPTAADLDVDDLLDQAGAPRGGGSSATVDAIPPRPVEITWPDTRRLKECIGHRVDVRVLVGDDGRVLEVRGPSPGEVAPACIDAAVETARRIRFEPGRVAGLPATLWTQVRIDFEKKR